ncbi:MAG: ATP-binding protein [Syntrophorhabdaceae bacterium]|nr:adenine nucleotide alpha hydrolase family protein [Syntrophorhabdaceae bacterium]MDD4196284.1 ATP-binding protein [Syntrophorhabdaceae bacterium]
MKCRICGQSASIALRSHKTAFCDTHFITFFEKRVQTTIRRYNLIRGDDRPIVAVSGGKDSLSLWVFLTRMGIAADGIYVDLGIGDYSRVSLEKIKSVADVIGRKVYIFHVPDIFKRDITAVAKALRRAPCSACGMIKRYVMNRVCVEKGYNLLLTGHNLDDEAAALFGNILYWKKEYLWKKDISLDEDEGHLSRKAKPFFLCSEREVAAYAIISGIDYIYEECPFSKGAKTITYKNILGGLEEASPGTKLMFIKGYLKELQEMKQGPARKNFRTDNAAGGYCEVCGYPSGGGMCGYCRTLQKFEIPCTVEFEEYG